jgi:hypothetical protein
VVATPGTRPGRYLRPISHAIVCGRRCGVERWQIKTLSDPERQLVNLIPQATTVEALAALPRPRSIGDRRSQPVEATTYQVDGYLAAWDNEADGDVHLVLAGLNNQRMTIVVEIPDPNCAGVCASGLDGQFASARKTLEAILREPNTADQSMRVRVTGVGFFDRNHGQAGAAPNLIELHPVLSIERR